MNSSHASAPPAIETIVESAIYADDLDRLESFYSNLLGLPVLGREKDRHVFFRVGSGSVLLAFKPESTLKGDVLPAHGAKGPGHFAMGIRTDLLDSWRQHVLASGVAIEKEVQWPRGGQSIYFRDPVGNLVELVTPGVWGLADGW